MLEKEGEPFDLAIRSRRNLSSQSGQMSCFAFEDLKLFPHWLQRILILLIASAPSLTVLHLFSIASLSR